MKIDGTLAQRELPDGRTLAVVSLVFGRARLTIGYGPDTWDRGY